MLRWPSSVEETQGPRRASGDVPVTLDQFTDTLPELPVFGWRQNASTAGAVLYCFFLGGYAVLVIVSSWLPILSPISHAPVFALCNLLLLAVTGVLQRHLWGQLKKEQQQGFLQFSAHLDWIVYQPFKIVAYGTAAVLVVVAWHSLQRRLGIPHLLLLRVVILAQIAWAGALVGIFIWKVHGHNCLQCEPDAMNALYSPMQPPPALGDIRYINGGGLAEQQAALLHYQQENLQHLSKEILRLQERLSKYKHSQDGCTPQVDLVHLLAAREQELRAITAERDQLQAEVRLARGLIGERDCDMLRTRSINDRLMEESARLRAMLDEGSSRAAKMELGLEAERLSNVELHRKINQLRQSTTESS